MSTIVDRGKVVLPGFAVGTFVAWQLAATVPVPSWHFADTFSAWAALAAGPFAALVIGIQVQSLMPSAPFMFLGIAAIPMILAHPFRRSFASGCLTVSGIVLWFLAGYAVIVEVVWGA